MERPVYLGHVFVVSGDAFSWLSRETSIRRDARGRWFHDGELVENKAIAQAFDRWIDRTEDGRYCLRNDVNWAYVEIEGPPIFVRSLSVRPRGEAVVTDLVLELSDQTFEALDPTSLRTDDGGRLYSTVRGGKLTAGFSSNAMAELAPFLGERDGQPTLVFGLRTFLIPTSLDPVF